MAARLTVAVLVLLLSSPAAAPAAAGQLRHTKWSVLLSKFVQQGRVDYRGLARERAIFDAYLGDLESTASKDFVTWPRNDRLAFWINAYSAYTVQLVLDHYPVKSIWDIGSIWRRALDGPFSIDFIPLGHLALALGKNKLSLNDIEKRILRERFQEPRIHFALVCASKGCPSLWSTAYEGPLLDKQLDESVRNFLDNRAKNFYSAADTTLHLSPIFHWFGEDFDPLGGVVAFFLRYGPADEVKQLRAADRAPRVTFTNYDWSLNERAAAPGQARSPRSENAGGAGKTRPPGAPGSTEGG